MTRQQKLERRRKISAAVKEFRQIIGCMICGTKEGVLTFHHTKPRTKKNTVCRLISNLNNPHIIFHEILKCAVLCEECHKRVHSYKKEKK
jgi:hypothetical protein